MPFFVLDSYMNIIISKLKNNLSWAGYKFLCPLACLVVLWGCATVPRETNAIASVDGEKITIEDLIYSLDISHRIEDLSSAGELDISGYIQRLVDDLLIVQEARRMGLEDHSAMRKKVDAYVLRESVVRLYKDEIVEKSSVSEAEIRESFRRDYERFTLGIIAVVSQEDADGILEKLKGGEDFGELAREHSTDYPRDGGEKTLKRKEMVPVFEKVVVDLTPGEISGVINAGDKFFYIVKLVKRQNAAEDEYEAAAKDIDKNLTNLKVSKRSDEYLAELRAKADVKIDRELLMALDLEKEESREERLKDKRVLVTVNDIVLTAGEFSVRLVPEQSDFRERALNSWIDIQVVNDEALSRQYELKSDLKDELRRYKGQLLKKIFTNQTVLPGISISREEMEDYYIKHKEDFIKPYRYRIQHITLKTMEDARDIVNSLDSGASFTWLAKKRSTDNFASKGGDSGWQIKDELPAPVAEMIDTLKPGEISPVLEIDDYFMVIGLKEKSEADFSELDAVKPIIQQSIFKEKYNEIYDDYVDRLKKDSRIEIYEEAIESYKAQFRE